MIEGAEEKEGDGVLWMERSEKRFSRRCSVCVCVCLIGGLVLLCQGIA